MKVIRLSKELFSKGLYDEMFEALAGGHFGKMFAFSETKFAPGDIESIDIYGKYFNQMYSLLQKNFPPEEIESARQFLQYLFDKNSGSWFVQVALNEKRAKGGGDVVGASLWSFIEGMNLVMYNIVVVEESERKTGVATRLFFELLKSADNRSRELGHSGIDYVLGEIEQPDFSVKGKEGELRNRIRPAFHDSVLGFRAVMPPNRNAFTYTLPIMASEEERREASERGKPYAEEELLFSLIPLKSKSKEEINARELARLVYWFYKDYLGKECSDVRQGDVDRLLAKTLNKLVGGEKISSEMFGIEGKRVLELIPDAMLRLVKISETALRRG
ncbi:MAG: hypothetical protein AB1468_02970 [Candidatus Micrarchaeota archaeon]